MRCVGAVNNCQMTHLFGRIAGHVSFHSDVIVMSNCKEKTLFSLAQSSLAILSCDEP